nr:immunoglobulin heavy chain junction region [Macaca mulatta]MOV39028.1 immunoglobulin heavy chain junction region [Macaca mulatta]MOV39496.1 immunoglobulin heavy chain junction region [Macaca mulatta]MOV40081.1 immunoglobulin heavy chain junction region [Macaca mulatta]MOV42972.1 immunoglobulin heavy chain junction region [Macaca mulatta]
CSRDWAGVHPSFDVW